MKSKEIIRYGITLFAITFVVALILSGANMLTKDRIASMALVEQNEAKKAVIGNVDFDEIKDLQVSGNNPIVVGLWVAEKASSPAAYIANVKPIGYSGTIDMMVGLDLNFAVLDVKIINHSETPGLGSKAATPEFSSQFKGKTKDLAVKKNGSPSDNEIVAISGATITTNAVAKGVKAAIEEASSIVSESTSSSQDGGAVSE